jgi:hypothetical protein
VHGGALDAGSAASPDDRVEITFDPAKREATLLHRQLDFVDAWEVFEGAVFKKTTPAQITVKSGL